MGAAVTCGITWPRTNINKYSGECENNLSESTEHRSRAQSRYTELQSYTTAFHFKILPPATNLIQTRPHLRAKNSLNVKKRRKVGNISRYKGLKHDIESHDERMSRPRRHFLSLWCNWHPIEVIQERVNKNKPWLPRAGPAQSALELEKGPSEGS